MLCGVINDSILLFLDILIIMNKIPERKEFKVLLISLFGFDIGAYAISAFMKEQGYSTYNIDFCHLKIPLEFMLNDYLTPEPIFHEHFPKKDLQLLLKLLKDINPDLIGLSVSSVCFRTAKWVTRSIKEIRDTPIVWGGIHAIISPEECIQHVDIVCKGEGEMAFYDTAERIRNRKPVSGINNMMIRIGREIEDNPMNELIGDLDSLPLANRLDGEKIFFIDQGKIVKNPACNAGYVLYGYPIMTTRGCRYKCSFCCNSIISEKYKGLGSYLRRRSVNHVISELKLAIQQKAVSFIRFWDDVFTYDEDWIDDFCRCYARDIGKSFICYAHPKHTKLSVLEKLSNIGLTMVYVGIQSGSLATNKELFKRDQSNKDIVEFTEKMQKLQITPNYDIIFDNFFEKAEDERSTVELLISLPRPYKVLLFSLCFFPKTPLTNRAIHEGYIRENDLEQYKSKAINNFFLCIQKSKDKHHLFWNCLKAMAVNKHFSKSFILFCMYTHFFKKYPIILFYLSRAWLFLFKQIGKKRQTDWLTPVINDGSFLDDYIIWKGSKGLHKSGDSSFMLFPCGRNRFCLRVNCKEGRKMCFEGFQLELISLKENVLSRKNIWRLIHSMNIDCVKDIIFEFKHPVIYCYVDGACIQAAPYKIYDKHLLRGKPYFLKVGILKKGNIIFTRLNCFIAASAILSVNEERQNSENSRRNTVAKRAY